MLVCMLDLSISIQKGRITFQKDGARPENVMRIRQHRIKIDCKH